MRFNIKLFVHRNKGEKHYCQLKVLLYHVHRSVIPKRSLKKNATELVLIMCFFNGSFDIHN